MMYIYIYIYLYGGRFSQNKRERIKTNSCSILLFIILCLFSHRELGKVHKARMILGLAKRSPFASKHLDAYKSIRA